MDGLLRAPPDPAGLDSVESHSGKRRHPRISMPVTIEIAGACYRARDWSPGGCAIDGDGPALGERDAAEHDVALRLRFVLGDGEHVVALMGRAVRFHGDRACAFQFLDTPGSETLRLEQLARHWLTGQVRKNPRERTGGGGIAVLQPQGRLMLPSMPLPAPIALPPAARLRGWLLTAAGLALVLARAAYVVASRLTVYSDYAAVVSDLQVIRAAGSGQIVNSTLQPGGLVHAGQVVAQMQPVVAPAVLSQAHATLALAQAKVEQHTALLATLRAGHERFTAFARHALSDSTAGRKLIESQITAEARVYDRLHRLAAMGWSSPLRADQEQVTLQTLQHTLTQAQADEAGAQLRLDEAIHGRFVADGRSTETSPTDAERDLRMAVAERDSAAASLSALSMRSDIVAPCDCSVATIVAPDLGFVTEGNPIANLAAAHGPAVQVDALVPSNLLSFVRVGQSVRVFLSDRSAASIGRVSAINYNPVDASRVGLPDALRTAGSHGVVTVALQDTGDVPVGLPAVVNTSVGLDMLLRNLPGLSTLLGLLDAAPPPAAEKGAAEKVAAEKMVVVKTAAAAP